MRLIRRKAFVFWYGAIAQLGERVLCKHEVVGSIPSGSTSLRSRSEQGCHAGAQRAKADWSLRASARQASCFPDWITVTTSSAKTSFRNRLLSPEHRLA